MEKNQKDLTPKQKLSQELAQQEQKLVNLEAKELNQKRLQQTEIQEKEITKIQQEIEKTTAEITRIQQEILNLEKETLGKGEELLRISKFADWGVDLPTNTKNQFLSIPNAIFAEDRMDFTKKTDSQNRHPAYDVYYKDPETQEQKACVIRPTFKEDGSFNAYEEPEEFQNFGRLIELKTKLENISEKTKETFEKTKEFFSSLANKGAKMLGGLFENTDKKIERLQEEIDDLESQDKAGNNSEIIKQKQEELNTLLEKKKAKEEKPGFLSKIFSKKEKNEKENGDTEEKNKQPNKILNWINKKYEEFNDKFFGVHITEGPELKEKRQKVASLDKQINTLTKQLNNKDLTEDQINGLNKSIKKLQETKEKVENEIKETIIKILDTKNSRLNKKYENIEKQLWTDFEAKNKEVLEKETEKKTLVTSFTNEIDSQKRTKLEKQIATINKEIEKLKKEREQIYQENRKSISEIIKELNKIELKKSSLEDKEELEADKKQKIESATEDLAGLEKKLEKLKQAQTRDEKEISITERHIRETKRDLEFLKLSKKEQLLEEQKKEIAYSSLKKSVLELGGDIDIRGIYQIKNTEELLNLYTKNLKEQRVKELGGLISAEKLQMFLDKIGETPQGRIAKQVINLAMVAGATIGGALSLDVIKNSELNQMIARKGVGVGIGALFTAITPYLASSELGRKLLNKLINTEKSEGKIDEFKMKAILKRAAVAGTFAVGGALITQVWPIAIISMLAFATKEGINYGFKSINKNVEEKIEEKREKLIEALGEQNKNGANDLIKSMIHSGLNLDKQTKILTERKLAKGVLLGAVMASAGIVSTDYYMEAKAERLEASGDKKEISLKEELEQKKETQENLRSTEAKIIEVEKEQNYLKAEKTQLEETIKDPEKVLGGGATEEQKTALAKGAEIRLKEVNEQLEENETKLENLEEQKAENIKEIVKPKEAIKPEETPLGTGQKEKVEFTVSETVNKGDGVTQTLRDLYKRAAFTSDTNEYFKGEVPEWFHKALGENPERTDWASFAEKLGVYKPDEVNDSLLVKEGDVLGFDENENLILKRGDQEIILARPDGQGGFEVEDWQKQMEGERFIDTKDKLEDFEEKTTKTQTTFEEGAGTKEGGEIHTYEELLNTKLKDIENIKNLTNEDWKTILSEYPDLSKESLLSFANLANLYETYDVEIDGKVADEITFEDFSKHISETWSKLTTGSGDEIQANYENLKLNEFYVLGKHGVISQIIESGETNSEATDTAQYYAGVYKEFTKTLILNRFIDEGGNLDPNFFNNYALDIDKNTKINFTEVTVKDFEKVLESENDALEELKEDIKTKAGTPEYNFNTMKAKDFMELADGGGFSDNENATRLHEEINQALKDGKITQDDINKKSLADIRSLLEIEDQKEIIEDNTIIGSADIKNVAKLNEVDNSLLSKMLNTHKVIMDNFVYEINKDGSKLDVSKLLDTPIKKLDNNTYGENVVLEYIRILKEETNLEPNTGGFLKKGESAINYISRALIKTPEDDLKDIKIKVLDFLTKDNTSNPDISTESEINSSTPIDTNETLNYTYETVKSSPAWRVVSKMNARDFFQAGLDPHQFQIEPLTNEEQKIFDYIYEQYEKALNIDRAIKNYPVNHPDTNVKELNKILYKTINDAKKN